MSVLGLDHMFAREMSTVKLRGSQASFSHTNQLMTVQLRTPLGSGQDGLQRVAHIPQPWSLKKRPGWCNARVHYHPWIGTWWTIVNNREQSWTIEKEYKRKHSSICNTFAIIRKEGQESTSLRSNSACLGCWNHPKKPGQVRSAQPIHQTYSKSSESVSICARNCCLYLRTLGEDFKVLERMVMQKSWQNSLQRFFVKDQFWPWGYINEVHILKTSK